MFQTPPHYIFFYKPSDTVKVLVYLVMANPMERTALFGSKKTETRTQARRTAAEQKKISRSVRARLCPPAT